MVCIVTRHLTVDANNSGPLSHIARKVKVTHLCYSVFLFVTVTPSSFIVERVVCIIWRNIIRYNQFISSIIHIVRLD